MILLPELGNNLYFSIIIVSENHLWNKFHKKEKMIFDSYIELVKKNHVVPVFTLGKDLKLLLQYIEV